MNQNLLEEWEDKKKEPNYERFVADIGNYVFKKSEETGLAKETKELLDSSDSEILRYFLLRSFYDRVRGQPDFRKKLGKSYLEVYKSDKFKEYADKALEESMSLDKLREKLWKVEDEVIREVVELHQKESRCLTDKIIDYFTGRYSVSQDTTKASKYMSKAINISASIADGIGFGTIVGGYPKAGFDIIIIAETMRNVSNYITHPEKEINLYEVLKKCQ